MCWVPRAKKKVAQIEYNIEVGTNAVVIAFFAKGFCRISMRY